jgi:hypothetical protein
MEKNIMIPQINLNQIDWVKVGLTATIVILLLIQFNCGGKVLESAITAKTEAKIAKENALKLKQEAVVFIEKAKLQTKKIDSLKTILSEKKKEIDLIDKKFNKEKYRNASLETAKQYYVDRFQYTNIPIEQKGLILDTIINRMVIGQLINGDVATAKLKLSQETLNAAENVISNQDIKIVNLDQGNDKLLLSLEQMTISSDKNADALKSVEKSLKRTNRAKNTFAITTMVFGVLAGALIIAN